MKQLTASSLHVILPQCDHNRRQLHLILGSAMRKFILLSDSCVLSALQSTRYIPLAAQRDAIVLPQNAPSKFLTKSLVS